MTLWTPHIWMPKRDLVLPKRSFMPGWFPSGAAGLLPPSVEFIDVDGSGANTTTYNFTDVPIGTPHPTREVFLTVHWRSGSGAGRTVSSGNIGGNAITNHIGAQSTGLGNEEGGNVISASVPTGTVADISITMSGECFDLDFGIFRVVRMASTTAFHTASDYNTNPSVSINVPQGGFVIASHTRFSPSSWVGANEVYDQAGVGSQYTMAGAFAHKLSEETGRTVSNTANISTLAVASFA